MPHDVNNNLIEVGDSVVFIGKVLQVTPQEEYCNVQVETSFPAKPDGAMSTFWFNASQVQVLPKGFKPATKQDLKELDALCK